MQFGIGILGAGWTIDGATERALANTMPARPNMHLHAACYAAKLAADHNFSEPPRQPDLTDEGIVRHLAGCSPSVRPSEANLIRAAYLATYTDQENTK